MIDTDNPIMWVRRIYLSDYKGDCYDFEVGELAMAVSGETIEYGRDGESGEAWDSCTVVQVARDRIPQFENEQWNWHADNPNFWIAKEDCEPVDADTDAKLRAYVALTGGVFVKEA